MSLLEISAIQYSYQNRKSVLKKVTTTMEKGKIYAILGPSGCGKTTLLSLLGGLDLPTKGEILYKGENISKIGLAKYRKHYVSFIFQSYNLIDYMNPIENVNLTSKKKALTVLEQVGLTGDETKRNVLKLSGGQQQRVAIARSLASDAEILLADEPTGNLDEETAEEIMNLLVESAHGQDQKCVIMVTHSPKLAEKADHILQLRKGVLQSA